MVASLTNSALFLDVDGTLLELQDQPDAVISNVELTLLLTRLRERTNGALALVSGRPLAELDRIFAPQLFTAAGGHGAQVRLPSGVTESDSTQLPEATTQRLENALSDLIGTFVEQKSHGLALHYRARPEARAAVRAAAEAELDRLGDQFEMLAGKMVFELVPKNINKGRAVARLMTDGVFRGKRPMFIGDDVTDEFGFAEVNSREGLSIRVGTFSDASQAMQHLDDVPSVHRWLAGLLRRPV